MASDDLRGCVAIDPGSRLMGVSYMLCSSDYSKVIYAESTTLRAVSGLDKRIRTIHDDRIARLAKLQDGLQSFMDKKRVDVASTEGAFANSRMPGAVIPLTLSIGMYTSLMRVLHPDVYVKWISPSEVKVAVGASTKNKDGISEGVVTALRELDYTFDVTGLSEHALDACAVNIARIMLLRKDLSNTTPQETD